MDETICQGLVPAGGRGDQWVVKPRLHGLIGQAESKRSYLAAKK